MSDHTTTQKALSDIQALKQALLHSKNKIPLTVSSVDTHLMLNLCTLFVSCSVIACEIIFHEISVNLIFAGTSPETRLAGMGFVGIALLSLLTIAYAYLSYRARNEKTSLADYNERYFTYFKNMTALSDIFVKFCMFSMLLLAGHAQWVAALFVLFLGDIIIQGRVLILSQRVAALLGVASFLIALTMFMTNTTTILIPAGIAVLASTWSLINILSFRNKMTDGD